MKPYAYHPADEGRVFRLADTGTGKRSVKLENGYMIITQEGASK